MDTACSVRGHAGISGRGRRRPESRSRGRLTDRLDGWVAPQLIRESAKQVAAIDLMALDALPGRTQGAEQMDSIERRIDGKIVPVSEGLQGFSLKCAQYARFGLVQLGHPRQLV